MIGKFWSSIRFKVAVLNFGPSCRNCANSLADISSAILLGQNSNTKMQMLLNNVGVKLHALSIVLTQQCNRVAALRLRRAFQILGLYQRIYGEQLLMQNVKRQFNFRTRPLLTLLSAAIFQWEQERVTDEELEKCCYEIEEVNKLLESSDKSSPVLEVKPCSYQHSDWENVVNTNDFKIWRRLIPNSTLYQYRVYGHFTDIPPRAFYNTQVDVDYWKDWDKNTMEVKIIDRDDKTDSEVVHWVYKFPYPMYPRDYVYVRRCKVNLATGTMVITGRSTDHPSCPLSDNYVRVATYCSQMVIKPYTTFDENGFYYVMTYFDDPQTNFPPMCYNWLASTGVHEFLEKVHKAACRKHEKSIEPAAARIDKNTNNIYSNIVHH
ncbi:stAR-related lipid transfer protein 7, mitochondrial-like [Physella acuta]|uniref:stAR-related lipid transfer protein 7, mitochondrial-like n=1 Tax=Physella acuta TaxID=109671 RepID=UPI0027DE01FD|nr:stAR-related lipid transfer protein 7, mitochondrial-like [Physella acuta]XP_059171537.1 stAR-related lipid transfer protein 7, mitochondrial-like [Physella acuta]